MYLALKNRLRNWLFQLGGPQSGAVVLVQRRVFILPTRQGLVFAAVLLLILLGAINYTLSLGFVLAFLLAGIGINSMLHTFRNLARLRVTAARSEPVFAGDIARFTVCIENPADAPRYSIGLTRTGKDIEYCDVPSHQMVFLGIGTPAVHRGVLQPGRLTLFTRYPVGLYYAWAYLELNMRCIVYPRPDPPGVPLPPVEKSSGEGSAHGQGQEDFSGLRRYHPGDSPRHIAWKAAAREQGLLTKQFSGRSDSQLWLSWELLPANMGVEQRLSRLARWVLDAQALGLSFGLRLPGTTLPVASGEAHREKCLETLALFGSEGSQHA